jgi:hypothetical protein
MHAGYRMMMVRRAIAEDVRHHLSPTSTAINRWRLFRAHIISLTGRIFSGHEALVEHHSDSLFFRLQTDYCLLLIAGDASNIVVGGDRVDSRYNMCVALYQKMLLCLQRKEKCSEREPLTKKTKQQQAAIQCVAIAKDVSSGHQLPLGRATRQRCCCLIIVFW